MKQTLDNTVITEIDADKRRRIAELLEEQTGPRTPWDYDQVAVPWGEATLKRLGEIFSPAASVGKTTLAGSIVLDTYLEFAYGYQVGIRVLWNTERSEPNDAKQITLTESLDSLRHLIPVNVKNREFDMPLLDTRPEAIADFIKDKILATIPDAWVEAVRAHNAVIEEGTALAKKIAVGAGEGWKGGVSWASSSYELMISHGVARITADWVHFQTKYDLPDDTPKTVRVTNTDKYYFTIGVPCRPLELHSRAFEWSSEGFTIRAMISASKPLLSIGKELARRGLTVAALAKAEYALNKISAETAREEQFRAVYERLRDASGGYFDFAYRGRASRSYKPPKFADQELDDFAPHGICKAGETAPVKGKIKVSNPKPDDNSVRFDMRMTPERAEFLLAFMKAQGWFDAQCE